MFGDFSDGSAAPAFGNDGDAHEDEERGDDGPRVPLFAE